MTEIEIKTFFPSKCSFYPNFFVRQYYYSLLIFNRWNRLGHICL